MFSEILKKPIIVLAGDYVVFTNKNSFLYGFEGVFDYCFTEETKSGDVTFCHVKINKNQKSGEQFFSGEDLDYIYIKCPFYELGLSRKFTELSNGATLSGWQNGFIITEGQLNE